MLKRLEFLILRALSSTWQQAKLKMQTSREQYYSVSAVQQLTSLSATFCPPRHRQRQTSKTLWTLSQCIMIPIAQRYCFNTRNPHGEGSILTCVAELYHLSEYCNFETSLNKMLCDWIVCGIEDQKIQQRLLAESELTFDKAFEFALASESTDKNAKEL